MCRLCVFAGTGEGRELIDHLSGRGARITACVATEYGEAILGGHADVEVCHGRMDGAEMADFLRRGKFDAVIDATHPYAAQATENIAAACREAGAPCMRLARTSGATETDGVFVKDAAACAAYLKDTQGNILLTTGSKNCPRSAIWRSACTRACCRCALRWMPARPAASPRAASSPCRGRLTRK